MKINERAYIVEYDEDCNDYCIYKGSSDECIKSFDVEIEALEYAYNLNEQVTKECNEEVNTWAKSNLNGK